MQENAYQLHNFDSVYHYTFQKYIFNIHPITMHF